jgi:hypothetical protein
MQVKHVSSKESKKTKEYRMIVKHVSSKQSDYQAPAVL